MFSHWLLLVSKCFRVTSFSESAWKEYLTWTEAVLCFYLSYMLLFVSDFPQIYRRLKTRNDLRTCLLLRLKNKEVWNWHKPKAKVDRMTLPISYSLINSSLEAPSHRAMHLSVCALKCNCLENIRMILFIFLVTLLCCWDCNRENKAVNQINKLLSCSKAKTKTPMPCRIHCNSGPHWQV